MQPAVLEGVTLLTSNLAEGRDRNVPCSVWHHIADIASRFVANDILGQQESFHGRRGNRRVRQPEKAVSTLLR
jgi:hypothetical protein